MIPEDQIRVGETNEPGSVREPFRTPLSCEVDALRTNIKAINSPVSFPAEDLLGHIFLALSHSPTPVSEWNS